MHSLKFNTLGSRGVRIHKFNGIDGGSLADLYNYGKFPDSPDEIGLYPEYSPKTQYK